MNKKQYQALLIDESQNGLTWVKKIIVYASSKAPNELKILGCALEFIDFIATKDKSTDLQRQIDDLFQHCSNQKEIIIGEVITKLLQILGSSPAANGLDFIKAAECLEICKTISTKSIEGQSNDPIIERDECIDLISKINPNRPAYIELMKVTKELEDNQLIYVHNDVASIDGIGSIGPKEYFFCLTDSLFQPWDPEIDSREFILASDVLNSMVSISKMDEKLCWGARRMNATIAWLDLAKMIENDRSLGGPYNYCLDWVILNPRASLFVDQE